MFNKWLCLCCACASIFLSFSRAECAEPVIDKNYALELKWSDTANLDDVATYSNVIDANTKQYNSKRLPGVEYCINIVTMSVDTLSITHLSPYYSTLLSKLNSFRKVVFTYEGGKKFAGYYDPENSLSIIQVKNPNNPLILLSNQDNDARIARATGIAMPIMTPAN